MPKNIGSQKTTFICDKFAEAYFKNGFYDVADDASQNALESAEKVTGLSFEEDLAYYR